jgi:hypothetical protein
VGKLSSAIVIARKNKESREMKIIQTTGRILVILFSLAVIPGISYSQTFEPMGGPGKKVPIGKNHYAVYAFDKKPQMGTVILKVELFDKEGKKDTSLQIKGKLDMPSMKGAHATADTPMQLNKKGDYLMPLSLVMPGEWEVELVFIQDKTVIHRGSIRFHV